MTGFFSVTLLLLTSFTTFAQIKMRPVGELINNVDPGWPVVNEWIASAKNKVEVLSADTLQAKDALYKTQVTTRSPMGAIVYMTGGILIDNGWIRLLGSGSEKLKRSLPEWNKGKTLSDFGEQPLFLLIADDVLGGFFCLNGGGLGKDVGKVYYLSPDNLMFEPLDLTYTDFLNFCFNGNLTRFYEGYRWPNWESDVANLNGDEVYNFYPCLWSKEGKDIKKVSKKAVPIEEQYSLNMDLRIQLGIDQNK
jgi:hypothetical protein